MGIREPLSWVQNIGLDNIQVETNALEVIHGINYHTLNSNCNIIIQDVREIANQLTILFLLHVKRFVNIVAHLLAKGVISKLGCVEWFDIHSFPLYKVLSFDSPF